MIDLIDIQEISEYLGVSRAYARDRIVKRPDFPRPAIDLSQKCRRWTRESFNDWLRTQTRLQAR